MKFCDVTLSYTETSGGIRTYIDQKRKYLINETDHEHVLVIPHEDDRVERGDRWITYHIASPILPGCAPYRFFLGTGKIKEALLDARPEFVELGSFFVCPWAVFDYRRELAAEKSACRIAGYFHTDVADAYVGTPIRHALTEALGGWSSLLEQLSVKLADTAEAGMERYVRAVFDHCDLKLAASPSQVQRLAEYGVEDAQVVPLGVDLETFHPRNRSREVRQRFAANEDSLVLIYAGRLDEEKHVHVLFDAFARLTEELDARLVVVGEGPLRDQFCERAAQLPGAYVLEYEGDPETFARLLASADIYVTAGPHETFGLSVVEAQASGLPVVGVNAGALVERVPECLGLLGEVDDAAAMAENIRRVASQRAELSRNARTHVEQNFSWTETFRRLLQLYEQLAPMPSYVDSRMIMTSGGRSGGSLPSRVS
jgi:alpha-1,6-mannosyltransferase